jgi:hypothetical protein
MCQPYVDLNNDVWAIIVEFLSPSTLKELCCVSRRFNSIAIPALYRDVNLTIPTEDPCSGVNILLPIITACVQQRRFLRTILANPKHASYVRKFKWTLKSPTRTRTAEWINDEERTNPHQQAYSVFEILSNVQTLDLNMHIDPKDFSAHQQTSLPSLFPRATSINLSGIAPPSLITAILSGTGKKYLTSLTLSTLFETPTHPSLNLNDPIPGFWLTQNNLKPPGPGNILGHLSSPDLLARCKYITSLSLSKVGPVNTFDHTTPDFEFLSERDRDICVEWARFIGDVRPKRVYLRNQSQPSTRMNPYHVCDNPASVVFREEVWPVLSAGWNGLEKIEVKGLGIDEQDLGEALERVDVLIDEPFEDAEVLSFSSWSAGV